LLRLGCPLLRAGWHARGVCGETRDMRGLDRTPPDKRLAALAARQWGVVSLAQLRALGFSQDAVERRARSGDAPDHPHLEADFYFPANHLVVETDGWDTHRTRHAFESDRAKDAALTAAGYTVVRFTWRQLRDDPATVADRLTAITRRCRASPPRARGGPARA
jgi:hypothetical protein